MKYLIISGTRNWNGIKFVAGLLGFLGGFTPKNLLGFSGYVPGFVNPALNIRPEQKLRHAVALTAWQDRKWTNFWLSLLRYSFIINNIQIIIIAITNLISFQKCQYNYQGQNRGLDPRVKLSVLACHKNWLTHEIVESKIVPRLTQKKWGPAAPRPHVFALCTHSVTFN